jgi:hypothetical protein
MLKLKYQFLLFFILSLLFVPLLSYGLVITEVQVAGDSPSDCYIKIYNPSDEVVDISGYRLRKKTSTGRDYSLRVFPAESYIKENDFFIWASSQNSSFPEEVEADVYSTQTIANNNSIALFDNNDILIDAVCWGESENSYCDKVVIENPQKNQKIKRKDDVGEFYLYPPPLSLNDIKEVETEKQEVKKNHPFFFGFLVSVVLSFLFLYIRKIIINI